MKCKYIYKSNQGTYHEFENEIKLDDFLLHTHKLELELGDIVFEIRDDAAVTRANAEKIQRQTEELKKKLKSVEYVDGEEIEDYRKPYIGTTKYLNQYVDGNGHPLFPIFTPEEYWKRRRMYWQDINQDITKDYDSETGTGVYTKEEKELIFDGEEPRRLKNSKDPITGRSEIDTWQKIIEQKWKLQGILGEDIHHCLEMFFKKYKGVPNYVKFRNNVNGFVELIKKHLSVSDEIIKTSFEYGFKLIEEIEKLTGSNASELEFYPELKISGKLDEPRQDGIEYLVGSIDLLVVDKEGNSYIFDYKTSPKQYEDYDTAKVRTFMYQFAVYNRLLQRFGFKDTGNRQFVLPILFVNYRLSNRDEAIINPDSAKFVYDNITWDEDAISRELTPKIKSDDNLNGNLDVFLPKIELKDVSTEKLIERVIEDENKLFGGLYQKKTYSDEDILKMIEDIKENEKGEFIYFIKGGYLNKPIIASSKQELFIKVRDLYRKFESFDQRRSEVIVNAIKESRKEGYESSEEAFQQLGIKKLFDESGDLEYINKLIQPYIEDKSWEVIEDLGLAHFGCIVLRNIHSKLIDVIKVSGKNLDYKLYHETAVKTSDGKNVKVKNSRRGNLTFNFETDIEEKLKTNSGMLKGTIGNIESTEVLLILNQKYNQLFGTDEYKIGNILVVNPFTGQASKAPNWQLEYSYKKLRTYQKIYEGEDHINNGNIKFMNLVDIVQGDFIREMESSDKAFGKDTRQFRTALTVLDSALDNQEKLEQIEKMLLLILNRYPTEVAQLNSNTASKPARLYNKLLLAAAELKGIKFKLLIDKNDKWPSLSITKALKNGLSSSYIDNPGNLDSETLNLLTKLVTEGYQNIRTDLAKEVPKVRELVKKLKKSKNFGWLKENTVGNEVSIFKGMFNELIQNDLVLKRISDLNSPEEKEFAKYFLRTVNRNRFPNKSELELQEMEDSYDIQYYRVPLAKGSVGSEIAMSGLFSTLKKRLSYWTPQNALKELRAKAEGFFTEETVELVDKADTDLFEMNNKFAKGDYDEEYRLKSIKDNSKEYFEHNLETLLLEHMFAYKAKEKLDEIFPMLRAAMTHLKVSGENEMNRKFTPDLEYAKNYIKAVIKNQPIDDNLKDMQVTAMASKLKQAASFVALAFSPVQAIYQTIQGLWVDISLRIRKPDGTNAFTFSNFSKAFKVVYADLFPWNELPSKVQLLNELYGVNDMDMNTYMKNIKSDQGGIFNVYDLAFKFTSRPDYYNRMTILVALMMHEGTWDAYEVVDGKLVYNHLKDKRFEHFRNNDRSNKERYDYEKGLYFAIAEQHVREGTLNPDGTEFKLNGDKYIPLPAAHTIQEIESFKALGDLIYGYYSHEKKSLIHYTIYGSFFMQMRTYWSGKKNLYLAPGGVRIQGRWVQAKDNEGKPLYYQVIDGKIRTDLPPVSDLNTGAPVVRWEGLWLEGIMVTLSSIALGAYDYMSNTKDYNIFGAIKHAVEEKYTKLTDMERALYNNVKQLVYDITLYWIVGSVAAGFLVNWEKELLKDSKEDGDLVSGMQTSMMNILAMSVRNSAADFAFWESIGNPALQWTPFSFETGKRIISNIWNTAMGDRTFWGGVTNTFAVTKQFKPLMQNIYPLTEPKEE